MLHYNWTLLHNALKQFVDNIESNSLSFHLPSVKVYNEKQGRRRINLVGVWVEIFQVW